MLHPVAGDAGEAVEHVHVRMQPYAAHHVPILGESSAEISIVEMDIRSEWNVERRWVLMEWKLVEFCEPHYFAPKLARKFHWPLTRNTPALQGSLKSTSPHVMDLSIGYELAEWGHLYVPEIHRLRGVFLKSLGSPAEEVERALLTAIKIAEKQGAFLLKLRASTSRARLWRDQGK